ncbi:MAG: hypothetical protein LBH13_01430, partial [Cellulomonadaceae bacterium]|nr:hypothetical protein [Cellulomonadaceae bacterium]
ETAIKGGEILLSKSAEASSDVQIKADRGPVTINGDVTGGGFPLITAYSTGITIVGNVTADGPVSLTAVDTDPSGNRPGSVLVKGKIAANDLNLTVDNASNIDVTGAVSVTNTVNAAVVNESKLRVGGALKASRIEAVAAIGGFADFIGAVTAEHAQLWACPWQTGPTSPNKPGTIMVRGDATFNDYSWIWACDGGEVRFFGALDSTVTDLTFGISDDEPWAFVGGSRSLTDPADTQEVIGETRYDVYQQSNGYPNGFDRILVRDMSYTPPLNRGTVSLSTTTPKVNDTLTVNTTKAFSPAATTLHYEWRADGAPIGKDAPSITVPASAVGKQIWVTVVGTRTGYVGDLVTTAKTSKVAKQTGPAKPAAPIAAATTSSAITLKATQGNEYSRNGTTWQASNTFTGLKPGAQYTFYQRVKETASRAPSATSTAAKIATAKAAGPAKPAVPVAASKTASAVTLKATAGHEYSRNGSTWQASNTFTGLQPGTQYTFYHRVKETSTTLASAHNSGKITTPLGTFASKGAVKITGTTKVGKTLTAKVTTPVSPSAGVTYSFQWLRGSTVVATSKASTKQTATYKLVARDKGKKITVKVTAIKAGYAKKTIQAVTAAIK